jgi:thioredoxin-related protein
MKIPITLLLLIFCLSTKAQVIEGIKFEKGLSWSAIKEKAKKENKYVFVDTYTTWCGPCIKMDKEIFPQKNVGDFFNKNFINVKVQIDRTNKDTEEIKNWYADAKLIQNTYKISSFPTYLFLNPDGNQVHEIRGGTDNSEEFIANASAALHPETQYNNLKKEFENGNRDTTFLKLLITTATSTYDFANNRIYIKSYLKTQTNLLSPKNIEYIAASLETSKDIGYEIILNRPKEVLAVIEKQYRDYIINSIVFDENILPILRINGKKEFSGGGMINYTGEINKNVDWEAIRLILDEKYEDRASKLMFDAKTTYYKWTNDWPNLNKILIEYTKKSEPIEEAVICNWLNYYVLVNEQKYFADAIPWASSLITINNKSTCTKNYGTLLYQAGLKEDAIKVLLAYINLSNKPEEGIEELINKMKRGSKID